MRRWLRLLVLVGILAVVLYPLAWMVGTSFKSPEEIVNNIGLVPREFTPGNFPDGWNKFELSFGRFFLNSAMVSLLVVLGNTVSCLLAAYAFGRLRFPLRRTWFAVMIGTLLLPGHVLIIPQYILFKSLGWVGGEWPYLPLLAPQFLATEAFFVFLMVQFMRGIPRDLEDAARIDGCGFLRIYWHVVVPLIKPSLAAIAVMTFIGSWNDFMGPLIYIADQRLYPLAFGLYAFSVQINNNPALSMAGSVLMTVPIIAVFFAAQRYFIQGVTLTGMKG